MIKKMRGTTGITMALLLLAPSAMEALAEGRWQQTGNIPTCEVWSANPEHDESVTWSGACEHGKAHGYGALVWRYRKEGNWEQSKYTGDMMDGKVHGFGVYEFASGNRYEGEFRNDKRHGHGIFEWASGSRYEGEWQNGRRHGRGVYLWANGSRYEGEWLDSRPHGDGVYTTVDGAQHINPSDSYYGVALKALKAADRSKFADELQGIVKHLEDIEERTLELAASLSVLALIHLDLGRIDEARLYAARAREIVERPFPAVRADVVLATSILGRFSLRLYDIAEAEKLIGRAASLSNALRRDDYVVFVAIANLASLMHQAGRAQKAEELSNQALTIAKETSISSSDPQVLRLERQLGEIYLNEQRYYESERQLDYVLAKSVTELGPTHLQVAYAHLSLAELYKVQARYAESERHHQQAIRVLRTLAPSGTLQEANTLTSLGDLYLYMGRYQEAELVLKPALAYKESVFGKDHPALVVVLHNLGALYGYQQRYGEAELVHQRVITLKENALGPEHPDLVLSFNSIANVYLEQGRFAEAKNYFARCVAIMEKFSPPREPLPNCLSGLAIVLKNQGEIEEAEKVQFQVLEVWRQLVGTNHPDYAISQFNIARIYDAQDRRNEADHWYNEALVTAERVMGADHPTLASWLEAYAHFLRRTGQGSHADVVNARAEAIRAKSD